MQGIWNFVLYHCNLKDQEDIANPKPKTLEKNFEKPKPPKNQIHPLP